MLVEVYSLVFTECTRNPRYIHKTLIDDTITRARVLVENERRRSACITNALSHKTIGSATHVGFGTIDIVAGVPPQTYPDWGTIPHFQRIIAANCTAMSHLPQLQPDSIYGHLVSFTFDASNRRELNALNLIADFSSNEENKVCGCWKNLFCGSKTGNLRSEEEQVRQMCLLLVSIVVLSFIPVLMQKYIFYSFAHRYNVT